MWDFANVIKMGRFSRLRGWALNAITSVLQEESTRRLYQGAKGNVKMQKSEI